MVQAKCIIQHIIQATPTKRAILKDLFYNAKYVVISSTYDFCQHQKPDVPFGQSWEKKDCKPGIKVCFSVQYGIIETINDNQFSFKDNPILGNI